VLAQKEKNNHLKNRNRKKKDKSYKRSVHSGTIPDGNWTLFLEKLSLLIGACDWSETNGKSLLRNWIDCV